MRTTRVFKTREEREEYELTFETAEDKETWEARFGVPVGPFEGEEEKKGPEPGRANKKKFQRRQQAFPNYRSGGSSPSSSSTSESSISDMPEKRMPGAAPPYSIHTPASVSRRRSKHDMPVRGAKDAPKTFTGKYTDVQLFVDHFERLIKKCRITSDHEKCELLLSYCSVDVQNIIRTLEGYEYRRWAILKTELLKYFDADRVYQKYKPVDVEAYAARKRLQTCYNLTQWRGYFLKYNTIAGGPLSRGHLSREDYNAYFLLGINVTLRQVLENRILQVNPHRDDDDQYTVAEINEAAEWYFRRNKYEALMVRAAVLGEERDEDYSGEDSDSSSDDPDESDYETYRKRKRQNKKKKKTDKKKRAAKIAADRDVQRYQGNEEEISKLISKLSKMNLEDPEYAPTYYKVMILDKSGIVEKCVKPPQLSRGDPSYSAQSRPSSRISSSKIESPPAAAPPVTYPNNIPLGRPAGGSSDVLTCYGCQEEGHRISDCRKVAELVARGIIFFNEETRKLVMKNGGMIRRGYGESLVQAAERIGGTSAPHVGLVLVDKSRDRQVAVQSFYQNVQEARSTAASRNEDDESEKESLLSSEEEAAGPYFQDVYLTSPRLVATEPMYVQPAERTETVVRKARKQVFDGVYPPSRPRSKLGEIRDLQGSKESERPGFRKKEEPPVVQEEEAKKMTEGTLAGKVPAESASPPVPAVGRLPEAKGKSNVRPLLPKKAPLTPEIQPFEARRVRFERNEDSEMSDVSSRERPAKSSGAKGEKTTKALTPTLPENEALRTDAGPGIKAAGRQSELTATVDRRGVMERILNMEIPMSLREIMVTSKELRTEIQDMIKVKNVRAVLLGKTLEHPLIASMGWPRSEGVLIKLDMRTGGRLVCAIIDTGSQLDIVRSDVAAWKIKREIDMEQAITMNDANGGKGELRGKIENVEFTCGAVVTSTDLWVSQQAPFGLLLGRPWQRGNLVSIDEREEGTYLVFKDRETRRPRYELFATPYEGSPQTPANSSQYQSFAFLKEADSREFGDAFSSRTDVLMCMKEKAELWRRRFSPVNLARIRSWAVGTICESANITNGRQRNTFLGWKCVQPISFQGPDRWIRVALGILSVLGTMVWNFWKQQSQGRLVQKAEAKTTIPLEIPYPSIIQPMSHALSPLASPVLANVEPQAPTPNLLDATYRPSTTPPQPGLEDVQYLIRVPPGDPPMPVVALSAGGPVATIAEAVSRQWQKYAEHQPVDVDPTFSAAPQSEYYGHVVLPNGQILHRSSAANVFRIFRNRETGAPFTMSCHEFTFHLTTPDDPQGVWDLELCYPEASRLRQAMATLVPLAAPDAGFPVHAAKEPPPMLPLHQRLTLDQDAQFDRASAQDVMAAKRTTVAPEAVLGDDGSPLAYLSQSAPFTALILGPHGIRYEATMARDIHRRAQESLRLDGDELFPSDSGSDSMPDLVSIYSSSSDSDDGMQALEQGICDLCLERQHASALDCSLFGIERAVREVKRLSNIWEDKKDEGGQGDLQMDADDSLAPTTSEWLSRRPVSVAFQALVAAAREARLAFEEFTVEFDVPHEGAASAGTIALLARETEGTGEVATGTNSDEGNGNGNVAVGIIRAASPVQRAESPYPRLIRETRGYATARAQDAAARVQRATRSLPSNPRRGELITREFWSSSPLPPSSDPSSPYDNDEYADEEVEVREMYRQETMSPGNWSPAVSDWSVEEFDLLPPFCVDPQRIVNWAVSRALNDLGAMSLGHEFASDEDSDADSREGLEVQAELPSTAESEEPPRVVPRDSGSASLVHELLRWIYEGKAHQQTHLHFEDEMGCEPANCALRALHGPLSTFVDYAAMAAEGILDLRCPSPPPYGLENYPLILDDTPSSDASSTSLDHSLPGRSLQLPVSADRSTAEDEVESGAPGDLEAMEIQQSAGLKRKNPDGEAGGLNQQGMRKKTSKFFGDSLRRMVLNREAVKATGLSDGTVVRFMAGVRLAILEAGRRIEDMVWHRYGITDVRDVWPRKTGAAANFRHDGMFQHSIPARFLHHPLLFDVEVAKLQTMWHILQRNRRIKLADALHELLSIKLRNEYVVSHILNAGYLDYNYPEYGSNYEDLLDDPETLSSHRRTFSEYQVHQYDADSEDQGSESSSGFLYPGAGEEEAFLGPCDHHGRRFCRICGSRRSNEARVQEHLRTYLAPDPDTNALGLAL